MKTIKLNNGIEMPQLGFGVFQVDDLITCQRAVSTAIDAGYRLFDTAQAYQNESAVGQAIKTSGISRDKFFITSKLWITNTLGTDPEKAIDHSLHELNTDYIDLYLIHMPFGDSFDAWRAMETAAKAGKIRAIGVSNFSPDQVTNLMLFNELKPAVNQIEVNPWNQQPALVDFNYKNNIQTEAWAPFAEGKQNIFTNPALTTIADNHRKTVGQVILRWLIQRGIVAIPKSVHTQRIAENFAIFDFHLSNEEMTMIQQLNQNHSEFFDPHDPEAIKTIVSGGRPGANKN